MQAITGFVALFLAEMVLAVGNAESARKRIDIHFSHGVGDLIDVQIPENIKAIEHARSLGDLRENSEFKFAKERQGLLQNRRSELEASLAETRTTDFRDVEVGDVVVPGCTVELTYAGNGKKEQFHVLGRFDSIPEKNIISYESPLGEVLLGAKVGEEMKMPSGDDATLTAILPLGEEMLAWLGKPED